MAQTTLSPDPFWTRPDLLNGLRKAARRMVEQSAPDQPDCCGVTPESAQEARRDWMWDMLSRSPETCSCEHDVQMMMQVYPGRF